MKRLCLALCCLALLVVGTVIVLVRGSASRPTEVADRQFSDPPWRPPPSEASRSGPFPTLPLPTLPTTTTIPAPPITPAALPRPVLPKQTTRTVPAPRIASTPVVAVGAGGKWGCIIAHESGGNPRAVNPSSGAGGLFQFLPSSWRAYGGSGRPQDAPVAEQWRIAYAAYARSGWSPWGGQPYTC